jgi:hypothetical protein
MIIDQLTPLLLKDSEEVNAQVKHLQAMLDVATMVDPALDRGDRGRVRTLTTAKARVGTQPTTSLPRRSVARNEIGTTGTCVTLSTTEMRVTILKTYTKSETALNTSDAMKGIMTTMVLTTTSFTNNVP